MKSLRTVADRFERLANGQKKAPEPVGGTWRNLRGFRYRTMRKLPTTMQIMQFMMSSPRNLSMQPRFDGLAGQCTPCLSPNVQI
jgi:hypothetical protein